MEKFSIPGVGGILEKKIEMKDHILIQERWKEDFADEMGLIEIPAGKIREFENIFDCLRREICEETGLEIVSIEGEAGCDIIEENGYKVLNYKPFSSSQNLLGDYPIMVQIFICNVKGELLKETNETKHISTSKSYLRYKGYNSF